MKGLEDAILPEDRTGFRDTGLIQEGIIQVSRLGLPTVDVFLLKQVTNLKKDQIYFRNALAFTDYGKTFDSFDRNLLWKITLMRGCETHIQEHKD